MSNKEEFKPLYHMHKPDPEVKGMEGFEKVHNPCEEIELKYQAEIKKLKGDLEALRFQLERLEREKARALEERDRVLRDLEKEKATQRLFENISERLLEALKKAKESTKEEIIGIVLRLLKEILITDLIPKEGLIVRLLSKALESGLELKGQVVLYLSPKDLERASSYIESLKEKINGVDLSVVVKEELKEGELLIETPKLWIERRYEDILQDLLEDLRNERAFQGIP